MTRKFTLVLVAAALIAPVSVAQTRGSFRGAGWGGHDFGRSYSGHRRYGVPSGYFLGDPDFFYDDYPFAPAMPEPVAPPVTVQTPVANQGEQAKTPSLLIELQGDRYVRYGGAAQSAQREASAQELVAGLPAGKNTSNSAQYNLPPTVLVYRDGHRENVTDYAIVGRVMYAHRSSDGQAEYGLSNIQLSALDIPATLCANRENGVSFVLPAGPNQIVTRP